MNVSTATIQGITAIEIPMVIEPSSDDHSRYSPQADLGIAVVKALIAQYDPRHDEKYQPVLNQCLIVGEIGSNGRLNPVTGALVYGMLASNLGKILICPEGNHQELQGISHRAFRTCQDAIDFFRGITYYEVAYTQPLLYKTLLPFSKLGNPPLEDITGLDEQKRQLGEALCAGKVALLVGQPGSGKTMLARRAGNFLPHRPDQQILEANLIYSAAGLLNTDRPRLTTMPFRAPHHTVSLAGIHGSASRVNVPKVGELALAHTGILFLDELTEFSRHVIDAVVTAHRTKEVRGIPTDFSLILSANRCYCGRDDRCNCSKDQWKRYQDRLASYLDTIGEVVTINL